MDNKHINKKEVSSETIDLIKNAASGDIDAKNMLIEQCANLVKYIVYRDFGSSSIDKEDLISIGYVGLTCAASKFFEKYHDKVIDGDADYYENFYNGKFIPYICKSITNSILMELRKLSTSPKTISLDSPIFSGNDGGKDIKLSDAISDGKDFVSDFADEESIKKLYSLLKKLPDEDRKIIMLYFGFYNNIKVPINKIAQYLKVDESIIYKRIVDILENFRNELLSKEEKQVLDEKKDVIRLSENRTIYEYFKEYSHEEVDNAIALLNEDKKEILHKRFGTDFNIPVTSYSLDKPERMLLSDVLNRTMKAKLKKLRNNNKIIYDYFKEYSKDEVDRAIHLLSKNNKKVLCKIFGNNFNIPVSLYLLDKSEKRSLFALNSAIKKRLNSPVNSNKLIYDYFKDYSHEEVDNAISKLDENDIKILYKRFGDDFNISVLSYSLDDVERTRLASILQKKIKLRLSNPDKVFDKVLIYDYFKEYSHEEVNRAVATLNENNKRILHKRFGDDFNVPVTSYSLDKPERMLLSDVLNKTMKTRLKNPVNSNKLIYDYFKDYSYEEVNIAISKLDEDDMKILHKRFGDDFNISVLSYSLNDVEKGKLGAILQQKIKARLDNPNKVFIKTLIYDYFEEYSHEEVNRAIFLLNENNKRILHKRFGDDFNIPVLSYSLDNSEKVLLYNVLYKAMKTKLKKLENDNKSSNDSQDKSKYVRKLKK